MTKRTMWWILCLLWTAIWGFLGMILWPFLILAFMSLTMVLVPVGVPDKPTQVHNPDGWNAHGSS